MGANTWVTAAHIVTGAKGKPYGRVTTKTVDFQILNPGGAGLQWLPEKFTVLQPDADVDVVALIPPSLLLDEATNVSPPPSSVGMLFGGACEFLGYALDGGWRAKMDTGGSFWFPFIKHCTVAGQDTDSRMWILDGINNPGFSGGPVIFGTGDSLKIAAVISGYYLQPTEVIRGNAAQLAPDAPKDYVNENSGFIIAYDIAHAVDAIKKNPTGPLRNAK